MAEEKKRKKIGTIVVDVILGFLIALVLGLQIDMMVTKKDNYDVPSLFGYSFMRVLTDSMEGSEEDSFNAGEGIIIRKESIDDVKPDDVITFYNNRIKYCVSHRVKEIAYAPKAQGQEGSFVVSSSQEYSLDRINWAKGGETVSLASGEFFFTRAIAADGAPEEPYVSHSIPSFSEAGKTMFYTCGDNLNADWYVESTGHSVASNYRDDVDSVFYVGSVISHSKALGDALGVVESVWFIPVVIMVPILIIAAMSVIDYVKAVNEEKKIEQAEYQKALAESGIDQSDERAVLIFEEKYKYKRETQKELEAIKKEQKEIYLRELKKAQEELKKDEEFQRIKEEEKQKVIEEMKKSREEKKQ